MNIAKNLPLLSVVWQHFITNIALLEDFAFIFNLSSAGTRDKDFNYEHLIKVAMKHTSNLYHNPSVLNVKLNPMLTRRNIGTCLSD